MGRAFTAAIACLLLGWLARAPASETASSPVGKKADGFSLPDVHGKPHALSAYADKVVVLAFLGTECPLVKHYAPRLRDLAAEYEPQGIAFLGIDANQQDSLAEIQAFARSNGITFPLLKDNRNQVADQFGAMRTPEVFLLDRGGVIRYWGRIDDQFGFKSGAGYAKPTLTDRSLANAIDDVLAAREVRRPVLKADGCIIGRITKTPPHGDVTYSKQIARIIQNRCLECHRPGEVAPFSMMSYEDVIGWADSIREVVDEGRMPPWFADPKFSNFANDARLSDEEKRLMFEWVDNGCPAGDARDLPEPRQYVDGWQMGQPDQIIYMDDKPFAVTAEGGQQYQYFTVDPGWTTNKWIAATETRPGNRGVVHHIRVYAEPQNVSDAVPRDGIGWYAPGFVPYVCPEGTAIFVPAHSQLEFQVHYTPNGTEQQDRSMIGVRFVDPRTIKKIVQGPAVDNQDFTIPPGDPNYLVWGSRTFTKDTLLLSLLPHMHLRGKDFTYEAIYPDGQNEVLLHVPRYDFNWQLRYIFEQPKLLPKGTKLRCTAHFDNSPDNLANPDPSKAVNVGGQSWDEMMEGLYTSIDAGQDLACIALTALSVTAPPEVAPDPAQR